MLSVFETNITSLQIKMVKTPSINFLLCVSISSLNLLRKSAPEIALSTLSYCKRELELPIHRNKSCG